MQQICAIGQEFINAAAEVVWEPHRVHDGGPFRDAWLVVED